MTDKKADVLREASVFANIWKNNTGDFNELILGITFLKIK